MRSVDKKKRTSTASVRLVQSEVGRLQPVDGNQEDEEEILIPGILEEDQEDQEAELHEEECAQEAKHIIPPPKPTPEMVESHNVSHLPFRSWCPHCVRGRGKSYPHRKVDHSQDGSDPVLSLDYGFFGAPGELPADAVGGSRMPVLVCRDRQSKALFTHLVPAKGVEHFYPEEALLRDIKFLGYSKVTLKSDQEPSIVALANAVKNSLSGKGIQCQIENSPKGDAHGMSNGEAELAVSLTQGLARTLRRIR